MRDCCQRSAVKLMRVALFLSLLFAALATSSRAYDGAVEVEVKANGDVHRGAQDDPIKAKFESRSDTQVDSPIAGDAVREKLTATQEKTSARASLLVLQKELKVVETMLALQAQKMQTLERMRTALSEEGESVSGLQTLGFNRRQSTQSIPQAELEEAIDRKLDVVTAHAVEGASRVPFDSYFVERAMMNLPADVVDIKIAKLKAFPTHDVVAIALRSGQVRISLASGQELLQIDTKLQDLTGVELDLASDPPLLAVFSSERNAQVCVYTLRVHHQSEASHDRTPGPLASEFSMTATALMKIPEKESHPGVAVSAIAIARSSRRSVISAAQSDNRIAFYSLNGSLVHDVSTGSNSVSVLTTYRHLIAFASGTSTFVFPMSRNKAPEYQHCQGSLAAVTSIAFDPVYPDVVYTGTADGEVLAFSLLANPETQALQCKLLHRSIVRRGQHVEIAVLKGYLVTASPMLVTLFNVSRTGNEISLGRVCSRVFDASAHQATTHLSVAENIHSTTVAIVYATTGNRMPSLLVLQGLFPDGASTVEASTPWRGVTTICMVAIAVLAAQYFLRRQQPPEKPDLSETEQWRDLIEKRRRDGPSSEFLGKGLNSNRSAAAAAATSEYMGDPTMFGATADSFARMKNRKTHQGFEGQVDDPELRRKIAEARRETLECTFDDDEGEDEY